MPASASASPALPAEAEEEDMDMMETSKLEGLEVRPKRGVAHDGPNGALRPDHIPFVGEGCSSLPPHLRRFQQSLFLWTDCTGHGVLSPAGGASYQGYSNADIGTCCTADSQARLTLTGVGFARPPAANTIDLRCRCAKSTTSPSSKASCSSTSDSPPCLALRGRRPLSQLALAHGGSAAPQHDNAISILLRP